MPDQRRTYITHTGRELTDEDFEAMADEADAGYDVATLKARRRGRPMLGTGPAAVVPVRIDPELRHAIDARAAAEHTTVSEVIRRGAEGVLGCRLTGLVRRCSLQTDRSCDADVTVVT